jgi:FixJ family two-component response regulator
MSTTSLYVAIVDDDQHACRSFARLLRASGMQAIIYSSAHDTPEARVGAEAAGCAAYFPKIDSGADVLAAIRRVAS